MKTLKNHREKMGLRVKVRISKIMRMSTKIRRMYVRDVCHLSHPVYMSKVYLYQLLVNGREKGRLKELQNPKALTDYLQTIDNIYENLEDYNPTKKRRVLIVFYDMITDMESYKKLSGIVTELFLRGKKLNISLVFISNFLKV